MRKQGLLLALILFWATSWAQQYPFVFYTPKDGLVNSRVRKIYQDSKGRLYFMTYGGLSIYDGSRFRNYTTQTGLLADMVNDVMEAGEDSFLVATNTSGMNLLVQGKIKPFHAADNFYPIVNQFLKSTDGAIYAAADEGLYRINKDSFEALPVPLAPTYIPPFLGSLIEFKDYFLFNINDLRHFRGLYLYNKTKRQVIDSMPQLVASGFGRDRTGQIWITVNDSIALIDTVSLMSGKLHILPLPPSYRAVTKFPTASFGFDDNYVWTIYDGKELIRTGLDGSQVRLTPNKDGSSGIVRVFIDKENIIWVCSSDYGVFKLVNTTLQINNPSPIKNAEGNVYYCSSTPDTTWFRDNNSLVRQTGEVTETFSTNIKGQVFWIKQSGSDLFCTTQQQLYRAEIPSKGTNRIQFKLLESLSGNNGYRGLGMRDPYGQMIFALVDSIIVFNNKKSVGRYLIYPNDFVENVSIDHSNRLWITCRGSGITVFTIHPEDPGTILSQSIIFKKNWQEVHPAA